MSLRDESSALDLIDRLEIGIILLDGEGRVLYWNSWLAERSGVMSHQAAGRTLEGLFPGQVTKRLLVAVEDACQRRRTSVLTPSLNRPPLPLYSVLVDGNRELLEQLIQVKPFGEAGCLIQVSDVTNSVRRERHLRDQEQHLRAVTQDMETARDAAEAAVVAKSMFLANVSHELRTPLNAVIGFAEVLQGQFFGRLNEKQADYLDSIHQAGRHLLDLINTLLDYAKVEAGKEQLSEEDLSLGALASDVHVLVRGRAARSGVELEFSLPQPHLVLRGDRTKMKSILINLLTNAIKFTPAGGRVELATERQADGGLAIRVSDNGVGIPPDRLEEVLAPFGQVRNEDHRATEGTGLGLPLTKAYVELHGGIMLLHSDLGKGTTVSLIFPPERIRLPTEIANAALQQSTNSP